MEWTDDDRDWLRRIAAEPDDDALRAVFADRLQQRGEPLGELLTLALRAAALPPSPERVALDRTAQALLQLHGARWRQAVAPHVVRADFRRGLLEHLELQPASWVEHGEAMLHAWPTLRSLALVPAAQGEGPEALEAFLRSPALRAITRLAPGPLEPRHVALLLSSACAPRLTRLRVPGGALGDRGAQALAAGALGPALVELDVSANAVGPEGARALARFAGLRRLEAANNPLAEAGVRALAAAPFRLHRLNLNACLLGGSAFVALAEGSAFTQLLELEVAQNAPGLVGCRALGAAPLPIERLNVGLCGLGESELRALLEGPGLPAVQQVRVHLNAVPEPQLAARVRAALRARAAM
jgi:uncharacterized protein (TIGR02996 family)